MVSQNSMGCYEKLSVSKHASQRIWHCIFTRSYKSMHTCAFMYVGRYTLNLAVGEPMNDHGSLVFPVELDFCGIKYCNSWEGVLGYLLFGRSVCCI